jgi:hypothetical protein
MIYVENNGTEYGLLATGDWLLIKRGVGCQQRPLRTGKQRPNRARRKLRGGCDLGVAQAARPERKNLGLALREAGKRGAHLAILLSSQQILARAWRIVDADPGEPELGAPLATKQVRATVQRHTAKPCHNRRAGLRVGRPLVERQKRLLGKVISCCVACNKPIGRPIDPGVVASKQILKGLCIATPKTLKQLVVELVLHEIPSHMKNTALPRFVTAAEKI